MKYKYFKECCNILAHSIKVGWELTRSFIQLSQLNMPCITIFGGAKEGKETDYSKKAFALAKKFVEHDVPVLTGGGPGIMEAVNCGAASGHDREKNEKRYTMGISVKGVDPWFESSCFYNIIHVNYFFMRKWLLTRYSVGFVVFPGGIGTMDELFEVLNLIKHHKIPEFPVILIGKDYWSNLINWFESTRERGMINDRLANLFIVTDDMDDAFNIVYEACKVFKKKV